MGFKILKYAFFAVVLAAFVCIPANPQGCAQCRETVGQTPAQTQTAYRRGIIVLVASSALVFGATLLTLKRFR